jgi:ABC-type phosphate transport system ATPase subunit/DNA-binding CsgD family transcriptional regulator
MNDLIPSFILKGRIIYEGQDLYEPKVDPVEVRRRIGIVFQKPNPFPKSIYENIAFGARINGYAGDMDELVERSLRRAAVWDECKDKLQESGYSLSGGQQQRLCIARTIATQPDVLLMDIRMPEMDGINAISLLRKEYDEVRIIVLTMYDDQEMISKMMEMGANAYLTKTTDPEEIYNAILTCMNDDFYFNDLLNKAVLMKLQQKKTTRQFYPKAVKFTEKEISILRLIAQDKTTEEISKEVFLSPRTIETIRQNMKTKVGVKTIAGLIMYGTRNKLID